MKNIFKYGCLPLVFSTVLVGCDTSESEQEIASTESSEPVQSEDARAVLSGEQLFTVCQACHNLSKGAPHKVGPNLYGLMGQPAASREGYVYSDALTESDIAWNKGLLMGWVLSAEAMVPNTWMAYHNHLSVENTERLVDYIISEID